MTQMFGSANELTAAARALSIAEAMRLVATRYPQKTKRIGHIENDNKKVIDCVLGAIQDILDDVKKPLHS